MKMKASAFRKVRPTMAARCQRLLKRYSHSVLTQVTQSAVCNQFHSLDARLARWLLMTHDRMGDDEFQTYAANFFRTCWACDAKASAWRRVVYRSWI